MQPALIGVFLILSCVLFAIAVIIFGGNKFFDKKNTAIAYFDDSLQGLSVGAPVTYRGIAIGQVKAIKIHINEVTDTDHQITVPVLITLSSENSVIRDNTKKGWKITPDEFLKTMCKQGLRAKLKMQSILTGKQYIDLAEYKGSVAVYHDKEGKYIEIPTLPSEMHQITQLVETMDFAAIYNKALNTLSSMETLSTSLAESLTKEDIQHLLSETSATVSNMNSILSQVNGQIGPLMDKINSSLADIDNLTTNADHAVNTFDKQLTPIIANLSKSLVDLDTTIELANTILSLAGKAITPNSPFYFRFTEAMRQLEDTAKSIQTLSDFLYRNPDSLILGLQNSGTGNHE